LNDAVTTSRKSAFLLPKILNTYGGVMPTSFAIVSI